MAAKRECSSTRCAAAETGDVYSIRKSGVDVLKSTVPDCGYSPETLRSMKQAGYYLYKNGKKVK